MTKENHKFIHLHTHSHYSLLDGLTKIDELVEKAKEFGMEAVALTDHGVMYGTIEFYQKAKKAGIKPIIGCLPPGHLIYTLEGMKPIEEIKVGDMVLTHRGRFRKVLRTMKRPHEGYIHGIKASNSNTVWVTGEHPILTTDSNLSEPLWIRADELDYGRKNTKGGIKNWRRYAAFPKLKTESQNYIYPLDYLDKNIYGLSDGRIRKVSKFNKYDSCGGSLLSPTLSVRAELARFFGLFIAEGSFQHDHHARPAALILSFGSHEGRLASFSEYAVSSLSNDTTSVSNRVEKNIREVHHSNSILARLFAGLFNKGAANKRIPPAAYRWSEDRLRALLDGIVTGDGKIDKKTGQVTLRIKSRDLAWGVKLLTSTLGYPSGVSHRIEEGGKEIYQVTWCPQGSYKRVLENNDFLFLPIKSVEKKQYNGFVYNFEVEDDNSYVSDITLHNCEVYITEDMHDKRPNSSGKNYYHLVLLAENNRGYKNLIKLVTAAHLEGFYYKPRIDRRLLRQCSDGLIALSACLSGEIPRAILSNQHEKARKLALEYQDIFGPDNFFIEIQHHPHLEEQGIVNEELIKLSQGLGIPLVASQDSHYLRSEDAHAHDVLLAVQTGNEVGDKDRLTLRNDDFSFLSPEKMAEKFSAIPEAVENTAKIAERCNVEIELGQTKLPKFQLPAGYDNDSYLEKLARAGLAKRYGPNPAKEITDRLGYELGVIRKTGFAPYFLIVQDFVNWAKENGIIVGPGRGSAAGSLVSYLLNITNIDPIKYGLLFERFLNPERISMPDIDLDFDDARRGEVFDYARKKYGNDHFAQIITFGTMAARGGVRDAGRALGFSYDFCDRIAKLIPFNPNQNEKSGFLKKCVQDVDELRQLYSTNPDVRTVVDAAMHFEGVARHSSTHACAVVITPEPLIEHVPLQKGTGEQDIITQYEMRSIDALGLLKIDFLGLANLTIIENALRLIEHNHGLKINIDEVPLDDKETFELLREGRTTGIFQLEGSGMRKYLKELKPTVFEDIATMIALYRPGPIELIPEFVARKHGRKRIEYLHPKLEPVLSNTYGIMIYQEQLMTAAQALAGFSLAEADILRKAVGKKIKKLLQDQKEKLIDGCKRNGVSDNVANRFWQLIEPFDRYGFNKSHSISYAMIGYQTAYLKAHYPVEFMAALMNSASDDVERIAFLIEECQSMGIEVLPPEINESYEKFAVPVPILQKMPRLSQSWDKGPNGSALNAKAMSASGRQIRFGLAAIKNVGVNVVRAIIKERKATGLFKSIEDFATRVQNKDLNKKSLESLIKCGALDRFGERGILLANVEQFLSHSRESQRTKLTGQISLFGSVEVALPPLRLIDASPITRAEKLMWEKELLGLFISDHPLKDYQQQLNFERDIVNIKDIVGKAISQQVKVGGIVTKTQKIITKNGRPMIFSWIEDLTSKIEVVVFPNILESNPDAFKENSVLIVSGKLNDRDGIPKLLCDNVRSIATAG